MDVIRQSVLRGLSFGKYFDFSFCLVQARASDSKLLQDTWLAT
jgi:hypothetical protein